MSRYGRDAEKQAFSYMDGVPVKIGENYKPPRKIVLSIGFQHRIPVEVIEEEYDFKLEHSVLEKIGEWRKLRLSAVASRQERIRAQEKLQQLSLGSESESSSGTSSVVYSNPSVSCTPSHNVTYPDSFCNSINPQQHAILTPIPISQISCDLITTKTFSQFNISDFEADTSSPFDNMELKTINDMEELAHVLQPVPNSPDSTKTESPTVHNNYSSTPPYNANHTITQYNTKPSKESMMLPHMNGYSSYGTGPRAKEEYEYSSNLQQGSVYSYYPDQTWNVNITGDIVGDHKPLTSGLSFPSAYNEHSSSNQDQDTPGRSLSKSVPDIVQELENELTEKRRAESSTVGSRISHTPPPRPNSFGSTGLENWKPWPDLDSPEQPQSSPSTRKSSLKKNNSFSSLPNPFHQLNKSEQALVRHISEMGFTLPRVARACQLLGEDGKKVVEFLLQVQSLEERWPGDRAERALIVNKYNYNHAVKHLEMMAQLLDLGFPEDRVSQALVMFDNDRDKALDHLIS